MKNKRTFKEAFGKNPWDPWSTKAGIDEASATLDAYLMARGYNPTHMPKDMKIAHSKSMAFKQWAMNRVNQEEVDQVDEVSMKTVKSYLSKTVDPIEGMPRPGMGKRMKGIAAAHQRLIGKKPTTKEEVELDEGSVQNMLYSRQQALRKKSGLPHPDYYKELGKSYDIEDDKERMAKQSEIKKKYSVKEDHVAIAMGRQLDDEGSMALTQLDIIEDAIADLRSAIKDPKMQIPAWVQSKITLASDYLDTVAHYMKSNNEDGMNESVLYDDPKGTLTRVAERKKELSRSARIIKSIYKKKGVMKEDTYDWEKDDKDTSTYGKQPKFAKSDDKASKVKKESDAAAVLSGGTTLTKQNRDIVELDPRMKLRPNKDAQDADDDNKSK